MKIIFFIIFFLSCISNSKIEIHDSSKVVKIEPLQEKTTKQEQVKHKKIKLEKNFQKQKHSKRNKSQKTNEEENLIWVGIGIAIVTLIRVIRWLYPIVKILLRLPV